MRGANGRQGATNISRGLDPGTPIREQPRSSSACILDRLRRAGRRRSALGILHGGADILDRGHRASGRAHRFKRSHAVLPRVSA
jgi:hypothetical protein